MKRVFVPAAEVWRPPARRVRRRRDPATGPSAAPPGNELNGVVALLSKHVHADGGDECQLPPDHSARLGTNAVVDVERAIAAMGESQTSGRVPGAAALLELVKEFGKRHGDVLHMRQRRTARGELELTGDRGAPIPLCCLRAGRAASVAQARGNAALKLTPVNHEAAEAALTSGVTDLKTVQEMAKEVWSLFGERPELLAAVREVVQVHSRASVASATETGRTRRYLIAVTVVLCACAKATWLALGPAAETQAESRDTANPTASREQLAAGAQLLVQCATDYLAKTASSDVAWFPLIASYAARLVGSTLCGPGDTVDLVRTGAYAGTRIRMARAVLHGLRAGWAEDTATWLPQPLLAELDKALLGLAQWENKRVLMWTHVQSIPQVRNMMGAFMDGPTVSSLVQQASCGLWAFNHAVRHGDKDALRILESREARRWLLSLLNVRTRLAVPLRSTAFHQALATMTATEVEVPVLFMGDDALARTRGVRTHPRCVPLLTLPDGKTNVDTGKLHGKALPIIEAELAHLLDLVFGTVSLVEAGVAEPAAALQAFRECQTDSVEKTITFIAQRGFAGKSSVFQSLTAQALRLQVTTAAAHACGAVLGAHKTRMLFLGVVLGGDEALPPGDTGALEDGPGSAAAMNDNEDDDDKDEDGGGAAAGLDLDGLPDEGELLLGRYSVQLTGPQLASAILGNRPNTQRRSYDTSDANGLLSHALEDTALLGELSAPAVAEFCQLDAGLRDWYRSRMLSPGVLAWRAARAADPTDSHSADDWLDDATEAGPDRLSLPAEHQRLAGIHHVARRVLTLYDRPRERHIHFMGNVYPTSRVLADHPILARSIARLMTDHSRTTLPSSDTDDDQAHQLAIRASSLTPQAKLVAQLLTDRRISPAVVDMAQDAALYHGMHAVAYLVLEADVIRILSERLKQLGNEVAPLASTTDGGDAKRDGLTNDITALRRILRLAEALQALSLAVWDALLNTAFRPHHPAPVIAIELASQARGIDRLRQAWCPALPRRSSHAGPSEVHLVTQLRAQLARASEQRDSARAAARDLAGLGLAGVLHAVAARANRCLLDGLGNSDAPLYRLLADLAGAQEQTRGPYDLQLAHQQLVHARIAAMAALVVGLGLPNCAPLNAATLNKTLVVRRRTASTDPGLVWAITPPLAKTLEAGCRATVWPIPAHLQVCAGLLVFTAYVRDGDLVRPIHSGESWLAGYPSNLTFEFAYEVVARKALADSDHLAPLSLELRRRVLDGQSLLAHRSAALRTLHLKAANPSPATPGLSPARLLDAHRELALKSQQAFDAWRNKAAVANAAGSLVANVAVARSNQ